jgi:hypothetical protein
VADVKLFLPNATLESWTVEEKADLKDGKLVIAETKASYPVVSAVHLHTLVTGADNHKLLAKVKTDEQLRALGAEHMSDSVLIGETAYEATQGFITEVAAPAKAEKSKAAGSPEADMLAAFILDKLS